MKGYFIKQPNGSLIPDDQDTIDFISKVKIGGAVSGEFKQPRKYWYHKRYFSLLQLGFEHWEPGTLMHKGITVQKNFERFRHDITILAGYYDFTLDINGNTKAIAKSISFASMSQDEFEKLYSKTIDVLLARVFNKTYSEDELRRVIDKIIGYMG